MIYPEIFCALIIFITTSFSVIGQTHLKVLPDLSGDELLEQLVEDYRPDQVLFYSQAKDVLYSDIYNETDSVKCVYSGHTLFLPDDVDPSFHLYMDASSDGINTEHTYPRSKGAAEDNGNPFSDMHHLFPTRLAVNVARSNFPFGEISDHQTTSWFFTNKSQSNVPEDNINAYSERINGKFEPREDHKGNVARAMFYFFTMYQQFAIDADPHYFDSQRETLCNWHYNDPVDEKEWERTFKIAEYQDGLPNPFILDCTLANRSFCSDFELPCALLTTAKEIEDPTLKVYPSPVYDRLYIESKGNRNVNIMNIKGELLFQRKFQNEIQVNFETFPSGTYVIQVGAQILKIVK